MDCEHALELLEAYALGALTRDERVELEGHLAHCPTCSAAAAAYAGVTERLPEALAAAAPVVVPAGLKARVFQAIQAPPAMSPRGDRSAANGSVPERARVEEGKGRAGPARPLAGFGGFNPARWRWAAAAVVVVLAVSVAWGVQSTRALMRERNLRADLAGRVEQQEIVLEVVDSSRTAKAFLRPSAADSTSYGKIYTRPDLPYIVAMTGRMPPAPQGQTYYLWITVDGHPRLAGTLEVNAQGFGLLVAETGANGPTFDSAYVTLEAPGVAQPTGTPVLLWQKGTARS